MSSQLVKNPKLGSKEFNEAYELIHYSGTTQINLLEILRLPEDILEKADQEKISVATKTMLANSKKFKKQEKPIRNS